MNIRPMLRSLRSDLARRLCLELKFAIRIFQLRLHLRIHQGLSCCFIISIMQGLSLGASAPLKESLIDHDHRHGPDCGHLAVQVCSD